jgi:hypothetical protein
MNYNKFNHTNIVNNAANQTWQHNPLHRGNIPYNNASLQQQFGKASTGNATPNPALQKTNITNPVNLKGATTPLNNNAITDLNKNGGLKSTDPKVDKNTKLNVNEKVNINNTNKTSPKTFDRRVNVDTKVKVNTNAVINNNAANNASRNANVQNATRNVNVQNVPRNVQAVKGASGVQKDKKGPQP